MAWETLTFDFANQASGTAVINFASTYDKATIFFNFLVPGTGETYYWDDVEFGGTSTGPCAGVTPDQNVLDDFECQANITYTFANATWNENIVNPNPSGINTSSNVGEFIHWGMGTDGAFGGTLDLSPIDLSNGNGELKIDVHPSAAGLPVIVVFQDSNGDDLALQTVNTSVSGAWETLVFDMSAAISSNDVSGIVFLVSPGDSIQHVVYFDNIRLDSAAAVVPCLGVTPDQKVLDDFDCQGNLTYTFANATWVEDVANPNPSGINTSANVGEFIHWGMGTDGAFGGTLDLAPLDLSVIGSDLKMDVHPSAIGLPIIVVFQDAAGTEVANVIATTTVAGAWETLSFDMSAAAAGGDVSAVVFLVSPGDSTQHVVYFDNIRLDAGAVVATCPGVTPDLDIMEDFECQRNINYTGISGNLSVIVNPDQSGVNTSSNAVRYYRSNLVTDEISGDLTLAPLDFTTHNQIKLDVWDANPPSVVTVTLLDAAGIFLESAIATTSVGDEWEQLNFDFQTVPFTISVAKLVLQFDANSPADSSKLYYFDNLKMDGLATGIRDLSISELAVYPNPVKDFVTVDLSSISTTDDLMLNIVAIDGRVVSSKMLENNLDKQIVDMSLLSSGIYYLELANSKTRWVGKITKE
jgi:hypothetical protein